MRSHEGGAHYDKNLTEQVMKYRALNMNIRSLEKYLNKAKNRKLYVRRSLEELGIDEAMLDDDEDDQEVHFGVISFENKSNEEEENTQQNVIQIQPNPDFVLPEHERRAVAVLKDVEKPKNVAHKVIVVGSSLEDEVVGLDLNANFSLCKVKIEPKDDTKQDIEIISDEAEKKQKLKQVVSDHVSHKSKKKHKKSEKKKHKKDKKKKKKVEERCACKTCGKQFSMKYNMQKHVKDKICTKPLEEREPRFGCRIEGYGKRCHTKSAICSHELGMHFNLKENFCLVEDCDKMFTHLSSLNNHKHRDHSEIFGPAPGSSKKTGQVQGLQVQAKKKKKKHTSSFSSDEDE